ncbi:MAG: class I SAM-dependent methyltransferase [Thermoanaerobaculia bacterium]
MRTIWNLEEAKAYHHHSPSLARLLARFLPRNESVIDLGCGVGFYADHLERKGFEVYAVEGTEGIQTIALFKRIISFDLSRPIDFTLPLSSVISLEVGEHLLPEQEEVFLDNLCKFCRDRLVLSWAVPGQGGYGHYNERTNDAIICRLFDRDFILDARGTDFLRQSFDHREAPYFRNTLMTFRRIPGSLPGRHRGRGPGRQKKRGAGRRAPRP